MLPKYLTLILTFLFFSLESRDLLGFYCRASIRYYAFFNVDSSTKFWQSYFTRKRSWCGGFSFPLSNNNKLKAR